MNESERLIALEKEIANLKSQLSRSDRPISICKPWEQVHFFIESETAKRKTPRTHEYWAFYDAVRGAVKVSMNLKNVRDLTEDKVVLALKRTELIIKAMETGVAPF